MTVKTWLALAIFYKIIDVFSTSYLIATRGTSVEANPFVYDMLWAYGSVTALIMNVLIFSLLVLVIYKHKEKGLLIVATCMQMAIAMVTTMAMFIY